MIGVILGVITSVVMICLYRKCEQKDWGNIVLSVTLGIVLCCCINVIGGIVADPVELQSAVEVVSSQEIISLQDASSVDGAFFLGSGSIDTSEYYVYYIKTDRGYQHQKISADSASRPVYIKYISDDTPPHVNTYARVDRSVLVKKADIWTSLIHYINYKDYAVGDVVDETTARPLWSDPDDCRVEIYVPKGSILEGYTIDG